MRKNLLLLVVAVCAGLYCLAQVPQAMNYQAIARNPDGTIIPGQNIGVRFSILDGGANGTVLYQETHQSVTNNFGLFTLAIGKGQAGTGTFAAIDWGTTSVKFLRVEIAPQGGSNYQLQGSTQFLSVPYALYAEKTKLVGGNGITITNGNTISAAYTAGNAINITGNTISANYIAGAGITITGNTISSSLTGNAWQLTGNAGTTAANFIGTTDDQRMYFRTNNKTRMFLERSITGSGSDLGLLSLSDEAGSATNPAQISIWGREIVGVGANMLIANNVTGQTWGMAVGNTQGRMIRFSQMNTPSFAQSHFYDLGITRDSSFYISDHWQQSGGGNVPRKMITISPQNLVGINLLNSEKPTANFHTKGSLRFEGVNADNTLTRVLVMDANGNVAARDASTFGGGGPVTNDWAVLGNSGTTTANFIGTTDDKRLNFRTNNIPRMYLDQSIVGFGSDLALLSLSDEARAATNPAQLTIWGRDIAGLSANMLLVNNVVGQTWGVAGGNTQGRLIRFSQMTTPVFTQSHYYDLGISKDSSFYISEHWFQSAGGIVPKKMITISAQNNVGINLLNSEKPTANFHTKGTLRFEGVNANNTLTRILVMDAAGNVSARDASTLGGANPFWVADANGIHNSNTGHVGIGGQSSSLHSLIVHMMDNTVDGRAMAKFTTNDSWQTYLWMHNTTNNASFGLLVGGAANTMTNYGVGAKGFGIANNLNPLTTIPFIITSDDKIGISSSLGGTDNLPRSRLHVRDGDIYINDIGAGVIMKSPNGSCWRMTVSDTGAPVFTSIPCP